ncbi:hypothetical protein FRB91_004382 [Serendipita sp. 411]|nr:hypothetical protein FRB91_004382 [Serendipita sp. 411]
MNAVQLLEYSLLNERFRKEKKGIHLEIPALVPKVPFDFMPSLTLDPGLPIDFFARMRSIRVLQIENGSRTRQAIVFSLVSISFVQVV